MLKYNTQFDLVKQTNVKMNYMDNSPQYESIIKLQYKCVTHYFEMLYLRVLSDIQFYLLHLLTSKDG